MNDLELKNLLLTTCPVLPGQENRAWHALRGKMMAMESSSQRGFFPVGLKNLGYAVLAVFLALAIFDLGMSMHPARHALAFADSQVPGIYATSFYSNSAQAQVVWLNGMDPATDKPTYLDPTTVVRSPKASSPKGRNTL